jgi:hypothetical protein
MIAPALGPIFTAAVIAVCAGAMASVGLMLYAGSRVGAPRLLLVLFAHPLRRSDGRVSLAVTVDDLTLDLPWV